MLFLNSQHQQPTNDTHFCYVVREFMEAHAFKRFRQLRRFIKLNVDFNYFGPN